MGGDLPIDSSMVDSQVEVIRSQAIASKVIDDLKLLESDDQDGGLLDALKGFFRSGQPASTGRQAPRLTTAIMQNLQTKRLGLSYVLEISYRDRAPEKAALIANALAENY